MTEQERNELVYGALQIASVHMFTAAKRRSYSGPQWAQTRADLRKHGDALKSIAADMAAGRVVIERR